MSFFPSQWENEIVQSKWNEDFPRFFSKTFMWCDDSHRLLLENQNQNPKENPLKNNNILHCFLAAAECMRTSISHHITNTHKLPLIVIEICLHSNIYTQSLHNIDTTLTHIHSVIHAFTHALRAVMVQLSHEYSTVTITEMIIIATMMTMPTTTITQWEASII